MATASGAPAYGDATYSVTDTWRLIAGVRYTHDHTVGTSYFYTLDGSNNPTTSDQTFPHTTWRAGLQHDLTRENMLYFTASTGFIAGGANPGGVTPFQPQTNTSYELGSKNTFITSDYVASVRTTVEAKLGGMAVFVNGAIGGMQSPLNAKVPGDLKDGTFEVEYTMTDPKNWVGDWKFTKRFNRKDDTDITEVHCLPDLNSHLPATSSKNLVK